MQRRRFIERFEARKKAYEMRKQARIAALEARRAQYERERKSPLGLGIGVSSIRRLPLRPAEFLKPYRGARVETVKPDLIPPKEPLVAVFDEGEHLRIYVQFKNIPWPEDVIGEL